jgi:hypothetical protein
MALAAAGIVDPFDRPRYRRRRDSDAVRNFAALWIRNWCNFGVVSVSRRRRVKGVE